MTRIVFDEVSIKGVKTWKDPATGKKRQQTKKFWQTVNPFNKNEDGSVKTRGQILDELQTQCNAWMKEPLDA